MRMVGFVVPRKKYNTRNFFSEIKRKSIPQCRGRISILGYTLKATEEVYVIATVTANEQIYNINCSKCNTLSNLSASIFSAAVAQILLPNTSV